MTLEEYKEANKDLQDLVFQQMNPWSEPKFDCPKCGGGMCKDNTKVLMSNPPMYEYCCNKCGHVEYLHY